MNKLIQHFILCRGTWFRFSSFEKLCTFLSGVDLLTI